MPRTMRYTDPRGRRQTLTWIQWVYLDKASMQFDQGWGGLSSTLVARLLESRGLITLHRYYTREVPSWRVTGRTKLGEQVMEAWRAKQEAEQE